MYLPLALRLILALVSAVSPTIAGSRPWWMIPALSSSCTEPAGLVCSDDCSQVMVCIGDGQGGYSPEVVATCDVGNNLICSAEKKDCVAAGESECVRPAGGSFTCHGIGTFPDPYDCQTFHFCVAEGEDSVNGSCPGSTAYNPLTADCTLTTSDRVCTEGPIAPCTEVEQVGVVPENPAIYYICQKQGDKIVPEMYRCPGDQIFDTTVVECVDALSTSSSSPATVTSPSSPSPTTVTPSSSSSSPTTATSSSTSSVPTTVTSSSSSSSPTTVTSSSSSSSPTTVTSSSSSSPTTVTSSSPTTVTSSSSSSSPTTVTSSSSSSSPTTVTSSSSSSSSPTTVTSPSSPSTLTTEAPSSSSSTSAPTSPTPTPGGTCTTQLEIAVDPLDCTSYYQCFGYKWLHLHCIDGFYFHPQEMKCVEGSC